MTITPFASISALSLWLAAAASAAYVTERTLTSPNGGVVFTLERDTSTNTLYHSVTCGGRAVVTRGALGLAVSGTGVVGGAGTVSNVAGNDINTTWQNPFGERSAVTDRCRDETLTLQDAGNGTLGVRLQVRAYDEGVAFRYLISGAGTLTVTADKTSFPLPSATQVWTSTTAQGVISKQALSSLSATVERPVLAELASDLDAAIGEAELLDFSRMRLIRTGTSTLLASLAGNASYTNSFTSPWRYVRVATSPAGLLQGNDFILNLNEPSAIADTSWIIPGKVLRELTLTTQGGIACIDFAASHGLQYIMFDAGWYGPENTTADATQVNVDPARSPGPLDLPAVIAYGKQKGVGVILYVNQLALTAQIDILPQLYQSWGVAGIKFGFVTVGSQAATQWLHDSVAKCAAHHLMVDIHDEYRPTGISRTYPNLMTVEGIRGDEESPTNAAVLNSVFTRCLAGAADQTNCYFASRVPTMGSHASQLAKSVCIFSPWQFLYWYDQPAASPVQAGSTISLLAEVPELTFFTRLPTTWDETRAIEGYPGSYCTIARRKGATWFLAGLNGSTARTFQIPLSFLDATKAYQAEIFVDDSTQSTTTRVRIDTRNADHTTILNQAVAASNGFAAILTVTGAYQETSKVITFETSQGYSANNDLSALNPNGTSNAAFTGANGWSLSTSSGAGRIVTTAASGEYAGSQAVQADATTGKTYLGAIKGHILSTHANSIAFDAQYASGIGVGFMKDNDADGLYDQGAAGTGGDSGMSFGVGGSGPKFEYRNANFGTETTGVAGTAGDWYHLDIQIGDSISGARAIVLSVRDLTTGADVDFDATTPGVQPWSFSVTDAAFGVAPELADGIYIRVTTGGTGGAKIDNLRATAATAPPDSYATWAASYGVGAANLDDDHDGLPNGIEYILGTDPTTPNSAGFATSFAGGNAVFTFTRSDASKTPDMTLAIDTSTDLVTWDPHIVGPTTATSGAGVTVVENPNTPGPDPGTDLIILTIPAAADARRFARLRVTVTP